MCRGRGNELGHYAGYLVLVGWDLFVVVIFDMAVTRLCFEPLTYMSLRVA